jgi:hypothetical protein
VKEYRLSVLRKIIAQGGDCTGVKCTYCPFDGPEACNVSGIKPHILVILARTELRDLTEEEANVV